MPSGHRPLERAFCVSVSLHLLLFSVRQAPVPRDLMVEMQTPIELSLVVNAARESPSPEPPIASSITVTPRVARPHKVRTPIALAPSTPVAADSGAIERTLRRIAATTQFSVAARRKAMLVVLRTWEDPARTPAAERWVDQLLRESAPE